MLRRGGALLAAVLAFAPSAGSARPGPVAATAMVSAADPRASAAGTEMLRAGGSATDASLATMLALTWKRSQTRGSTARPLVIEWPKSPCKTWLSQRRNCSGSAWSRPSRSRSRASESASAASPSISCAGSPGISRISVNTAMPTSSRVGSAIAMRRVM